MVCLNMLYLRAVHQETVIITVIATLKSYNRICSLVVAIGDMVVAVLYKDLRTELYQGYLILIKEYYEI